MSQEAAKAPFLNGGGGVNVHQETVELGNPFNDLEHITVRHKRKCKEKKKKKKRKKG